MIMPILAVSDMTASLDFYVGKLGWTKTFSMSGEDGQDMFAIVSMNQGVTFGLSAMGAPEPRGTGVVFMSYVAPEADIDEYYAVCQGNGATIAQEIKNEYWGDRCFGVTDPDGYYHNICKTVEAKSPEEILASHSQN